MRIWRSFVRAKKWTTDTLDLLHALRSQGEEPKEVLSLGIATQRPPQAVRIGLLKISN